MAWPFKKKAAIYNSRFLGYFGTQNHTYNQIFSASQNNHLLIDYFNNIAEVAAPVLKHSDGARQIGFITDNKEVEKLLNNPNYYQGFNEWFSQLVMYYSLLGTSIINVFTSLKFGSGTKPTSLYNLAPQHISLKLFKESDFRTNPIDKYIFDSNEIGKNVLSIEPENILHLRESSPNFKNNQFLFGESRYAGCYRNIESIVEGYSAKVNLYKNGPRLIITGKTQGDFASTNNTDSLEVVQSKLDKYGMTADRFNIMMTDVPLDVTQASLNVKEMQILENNQSDFQRLCDAQGMDSKIFSDNGGATFSNKKAALSDFYNNSFRSSIDGIFKDLKEKLKEYWPTLEVLIPDYSQISEITNENNIEKERVLKGAEKGIITRNEYLAITGQNVRDEKEFDELFFLTGTGWIKNTQDG